MKQLKVKELVVALFVGLSVEQVGATDTRHPSSLSWRNYAQVKNYVQRSEDDKVHLSIDWYNTVIDAQRAAQREDKPLLLWFYFGDPRANC